MTGINKHIASILLGLFIFPIFFQSVHIAWHQSQSIEHKSHLSIAIGNHDIQNKPLIISHEDSFCPVCEYEFSIHHLPAVFVFEAQLPMLKGIQNETIQSHPQLEAYRTKSSRGPPDLNYL